MNSRRFKLWLLGTTAALSACGGGGDATPIEPLQPPLPQGPEVTVTGRVSFDRVPFKIAPAQGLDFARVLDAPARGVAVEAVDASTSDILASSSTDASGSYALTVPGNRNVFVRAKAQMSVTGTPSWNFRVLNNTNGNALYALDSVTFNSGTAASVRNLHAASGWTGANYATTRSAAPFAILDTVYRAKELLLTAQATLVMPALDLYWSASNRPSFTLCPSTGEIVSTGYLVGVPHDCATPGTAPDGIYVQGDFSNGVGDTDEFDESVVAHEFGHYVEGAIARSDSIGGSHSANARLDPRVAFSEGWGNAFSAMVLNLPTYRDSFGVNAESNVDIESGADANAGWYSEASVHEILWDVFDAPSDTNDALTLGFGPLFHTLIGPHRNTLALTGLHSFITGLKTVAPSASTAIDSLVSLPPRNITGLGDFAVGETNSAGEANVLPVYVPIDLNQSTALHVCSTARFGSYNRLANRRFLKLDLPTALTVAIVVTAEAHPGQPGSFAASDPDFVLWRQGVRVYNGLSTVPGQESRTLPLSAGTHILEVYDYLYANSGSAVTTTTPRCMKVTVTG